MLARSEFDPDGPLELKQVEELFTRTSEIVELELAGRVIGTTVEHPFFVPAQGEFVAAKDLQVGDELVSHDGRLIKLDAIRSTSRVTTVYNMRVADHHTYFVGGSAWGFDVWVHNATCSVLKGSRSVEKNPQIRTVGDIITNATTAAESSVSALTHASALTGLAKVDNYINILRAQNGSSHTLSAKLIARFTNAEGLTDWNKMLTVFKGHAIQAHVDQALRQNPLTSKLILQNKLFLDQGSKLRIKNNKENLVRPDYQLSLDSGKWAIFDITTVKEAGKALDKYDHYKVSYLAEMLY